VRRLLQHRRLSRLQRKAGEQRIRV